MKYFRNIIGLFSNKYALVGLAFFVWLAFFDDNSLLSQIRLTKELSKVKKEKNFYISEIEKDKITTTDLMSNMDNLERFAREQYLMKADNEDVFLIIHETNDEKKLRLKCAKN